MIAFLEHLVFHDFWLKLFSLVLAILIWFTVSLASQKEVSPVGPLMRNLAQRTFLKLPVVVLSSAEGVGEIQIHPQEVEVTIEGEPRTLQNVQSKDIRAIVDLTGIKAAELRKRIEVSTPAGVTHVRVAPQEVEIVYPKNSR
jgi:YbbR domain-containing protein